VIARALGWSVMLAATLSPPQPIDPVAYTPPQLARGARAETGWFVTTFTVSGPALLHFIDDDGGDRSIFPPAAVPFAQGLASMGADRALVLGGSPTAAFIVDLDGGVVSSPPLLPLVVTKWAAAAEPGGFAIVWQGPLQVDAGTTYFTQRFDAQLAPRDVAPLALAWDQELSDPIVVWDGQEYVMIKSNTTVETAVLSAAGGLSTGPVFPVMWNPMVAAGGGGHAATIGQRFLGGSTYAVEGFIAPDWAPVSVHMGPAVPELALAALADQFVVVGDGLNATRIFVDGGTSPWPTPWIDDGGTLQPYGGLLLDGPRESLFAAAYPTPFGAPALRARLVPADGGAPGPLLPALLDANDETFPDFALNGDRVLVTWVDSRVVGDQASQWGAILDAQGARVRGPFPLFVGAPVSPASTRRTVATEGGWNVLVQTVFYAYNVPVDFDGGVGAKQLITPQTSVIYDCHAASIAGVTLEVYTQMDVLPNYSVYAVRVGPDGGLLDSPPLVLDTVDGGLPFIDVAKESGGFTVQVNESGTGRVLLIRVPAGTGVPDLPLVLPTLSSDPYCDQLECVAGACVLLRTLDGGAMQLLPLDGGTALGLVVPDCASLQSDGERLFIVFRDGGTQAFEPDGGLIDAPFGVDPQACLGAAPNGGTWVIGAETAPDPLHQQLRLRVITFGGAGTDAGLDAGVDAGTDGGEDGGPPQSPHFYSVGCGCDAGGPGLSLVLLALSRRKKRRS
jgi:hypothetical protein